MPNLWLIKYTHMHMKHITQFVCYQSWNFIRMKAEKNVSEWWMSDRNQIVFQRILPIPTSCADSPCEIGFGERRAKEGGDVES